MWFRIFLVIVVLIISMSINFYLYQDYTNRKNTKWIKVEAEILETTLDSKTVTNSTTTKWGNDRPVNVFVERFDNNNQFTPYGKIDFNTVDNKAVDIMLVDNKLIENYAVYSGTSTTENQFQVLTRYKYTYPEGKVHQVWGTATDYSTQLIAQNQLINFPVGKKIMIYVQENNPEISQIQAPDKSFNFWGFMINLFFTFLACFIVIFGEFTGPTSRYGTNVYVY